MSGRRYPIKAALGTLLFSTTLWGGPYIEVGLAVPLTPGYGYIPNSYGIAAAGYNHAFDDMVSVRIGFVHRSLTGGDDCNNRKCYGDNAIESRLRFEWK